MIVNLLTKKSISRLIIGLSVPFCCLSIEAAAGNAEYESLANISNTAKRFALNHVDTSGLSNITASTTKMDSRLRLVKCQQPLEAFTTSPSRNISRTTVGIRCTGNKPWSIYVPVNISATAQVVYTKRPLIRGEVVHKSDLEIRQMPLDRLPTNYFDKISELTGMELRRSLKSGVVLNINAVTVRRLIQQGQEVVILAKTNTIQVKMNGVALKNGAEGELIPIRNVNSGRTIEAMVVDAKTVAVNM